MTEEKQLKKLISRWSNGEIDVLCGNLESMSHGLNLHLCSPHVCFFSLSYSFGNYDQFIARAYRFGIHRAVNVYHLLLNNTIDDVMLKAVKNKHTNQSNFRQSITQYIKANQ